MTGLPRRVARRWYMAGSILSLVAIVFGVLSRINPRIGYPLAFMFTMFGVIAVTRPGWEWPERRRGIVLVNSGAFVLEMAILYSGITSGTSGG